jgi:hypothetical protein
MRAQILLGLLGLLAGPAIAQGWPIPWDGYWRVPGDTCDLAARHDGPDTFTETACHGLSARPLATPATWEVVMRCDDGGRVWDAPRIVMLNGDRLYVWFGPGGAAPLEFLRCEAGG